MENVKKKGNKAVTVGIIIAGIIFFLLIWGTLLSKIFGNTGETTLNRVSAEGMIDVIYVNGMIGEGSSLFSEPSYKHKWTIDQIDNLMRTSSNRAILLYVNSPGGGVYESDELYIKLKEYKEVTGRPIYAYMAQTAASGGYYVCMAADKVYANRMTLTGSIGVIMSTMDTTELEGKIGIKTENIVSGKNKAMGNPLTAEQREILQDMVDETYTTFVEIVSENRSIDLEQIKKIADGRIYSAKQAKALNLIDEIGDFSTTISDLQEAHGLEGAIVNDVVSEMTFFNQLFGTVSKNFSLVNEFATIKEYLEGKNSGKLMYYYSLE